MKKAFALASVLLLSACGGSTVPADAPAPETADDTAAISLPSERSTSTSQCRTSLRRAGIQADAPFVSLSACDNLVDWMSSLEQYPGALQLAGDEQVTADEVAALCEGRDSAPVCADAIERGIVESTGDDQPRGTLAVAAIACQAEVGLADQGLALTLSTPGGEPAEGQFDTVNCVLDATQAPEDVRSGVTSPADGAQTTTWENLQADWTHTVDEGLNLTLTEVGA